MRAGDRVTHRDGWRAVVVRRAGVARAVVLPLVESTRGALGPRFVMVSRDDLRPESAPC